MLAEKIAEEIHGDARAHFAEHPTNGFMHEVVRVMQVCLGIAKAPRGIAQLGGLPRTDDAHALLPQAGTGSKFVKQLNLIVLVAQI